MRPPLLSPAVLLLVLACLLCVGCGGDDDDSAIGDDDDSAAGDDDDTAGDDDDSAAAFAPAYEFDSRFEAGMSSVSNSGQMFRQVLISNITSYVGDLTGKLDDTTSPLDPTLVTSQLDAYYTWNGDLLSNEHGISTTPAASQVYFSDIHSSGKSLSGKIAGADSGQHVDWSTALAGWNTTGSVSPDGLVQAWFSELQTQAVDWSNGTYPLGPDGAPVSAVYKTAAGHDLQQLLQKFLMGAVSFSQAADDYLDEGLTKDNTEAADTGKPYSDLEHAWDEGFGYYGASRNNDAYTDADANADDADLGAIL